MERTMIMFERLLNDKLKPKIVKNSMGAVRIVPYGSWLRKHHADKFKAAYEKWAVKGE